MEENSQIYKSLIIEHADKGVISSLAVLSIAGDMSLPASLSL